MVVEQSNIDHIMRGLQSTEGVRLHNHRKKLRQRFDIIKKLGQGTYGKVQLGINKETGQEVAIKTIKKCKIETEADLVRIRREIQIMSSVRHPNIIHIYEVFENREKMVLVMEYAAGGELYDFLNERKVLEETEARRIFRQISTAVYYCHKHKICHRDLKLENILLDEHGSAKIADFGLSNVFEETRLLKTFCGSPLYASPEIVRGTPYRGPEVDCWSLGVLLYTLVYGAMPFDGSNFKRLVKQISTGDYFEPKKPKASPASPLIKEMLTVDPNKRASIEQICSHWWVNQGFNVSCLDIAEDLANQTPVRLDLLLSLAPPPENSDNLVVTDEQASMSSQEPPPRSMSVGSILDLNQEDRRLELLDEKVSKRKLDTAPSETSMTKTSPKKKDNRLSDEKAVESAPEPPAVMDVDSECAAAAVAVPEDKSSTERQKSVPPEGAKTPTEPKREGSITSDKPTRKSVKTVKKKVTKEGVGEVKKKKAEGDEKPEDKEKKKDSRASEPREEVGKEIKRENSVKKKNLKLNLKKEREKSEPPMTPDETPTKPTERRKSKIFETAEKFMSPEPKSPTVEKPKKLCLPGVKVSDFAKAFERKSSVQSSTPLLRKSVPKDDNKEGTPTDDKKNESSPVSDSQPIETASPEKQIAPKEPETVEKKKKAITKPPVPRTKTDESVNSIENRKKSLTLQIGNEKATVELHSPENTKFLFEPEKTSQGKENEVKEKKTAKVNITLKSNTLPRRTSKAEIQLASPNYRTEVEHRVGDVSTAPRGFRTQRSEVAFPVSAAQKPVRAMSLEPENKRKERIIPIQFEDKGDKSDEARDRVAELERQDSAVRGRPPTMPYQRTLSQRSSSLSRQSTQDSDTESTMSMSGDPIKKSPREFIIPIAVEGGGYVTPRATSLEPSESMSKRRPFPRRISMFSDNGSEDESSWRHELDEPFRLHRLRSSRAARADSLSGSEDDEDDGFEILTAENLFSTLLSRVQSLTQRLNVDHGGRPGFPSRLPNQRFFQGFHEPITRLTERSLSRDMDGARWPRGSDVSDSSIRSVPREKSRTRQNENSLESVNRQRRSHRSSSNSRPSDDQSRAPSAHRSLSDAVPSAFARTWTNDDVRNLNEAASRAAYNRSQSLRDDETKPAHSRSQSDSAAIAEADEKGSDFYDILAEKYGVVPVKRYDIEPRRRRSRSRDSKTETLEVVNPETPQTIQSGSPARSKKEATPGEKYQTPSEKLAAVLSQLETAHEKKEARERELRGIPNDLLYPKKEKPQKQTELLKVDNDRLKDLSPKALELYEKTLGLYQRSLNRQGKKNAPKIPDVTPEQMRDDYFKNKKLKHYGGFVKAINDKEEARSSEGESASREDSPSVSKKEKLIRRLSRELENEMSSKDDVVKRRPIDALKQDESLIRRLSKELEKEMDKNNEKPAVESKEPDPEQKKSTAKAIILTTLEKKLDKLKPNTDKKYIDKAIRSLRESSVGPKENVSENFFIKRAVSLSECAEPSKPATSIGPIQSTVNSVLGFFKKADVKSKQTQASINLMESTPPLLTPEASPTKSNSSPKKDVKESPSRRLSLRSGNSPLMSLNDSSSFVSPDSESLDSWSNCSDFGTPDELATTPKPISPIMRNYDDGPSESVGERIRRKSFYTRFNDRKKSRSGRSRSDAGTSGEIPAYTKSATQNLEKVRSPQPYVRSSTSADYSRKWYDDSRPKPFYKSDATSSNAESPYRKTSLDWSKTLSPPTFVRSHSQSSSVSNSLPATSTLPRTYVGSYDSLRRVPSDIDRPFSPTRLRTPGRPFSPSSASPTFD